MTVQKLIEELTKYPSDAEVTFELYQNATLPVAIETDDGAETTIGDVTLHELPEIEYFRLYKYSYPELYIGLRF